jgi:hypothetical protein
VVLASCAAGAAWAAETSDAVLTARLADVRAIREIKRLQHMWAHYAEAGQFADMAALVTPGGSWTDGTTTRTGRAEIEDHVRSAAGGGAAGLAPDRLNIHLFLCPVITLSPDGRSAKGRWHEVVMAGQAGQSAVWAGGINVIDYALAADGWAISQIRYHPQFAGPYSSGWRHVTPVVPMVSYHYTPDQAGQPWGVARPVEAALPAARIAAEAELLLAESAAHNLQAAYGFYLDRKLYDDVVDLFAADAVIDIAGVGRFTGHDGIRRALARFGTAGLERGELNDRPQLMPVVTVAADGTRAELRNIELGMTGQHAGETWWSSAVQQFDIAKGSDGVWRIAGLRHYPRMRAAYAQGWQEPLAAALPQPAGSTPDAPSALPEAFYPQHASPAAQFARSLASEPSFAGTGDGATALARAAAFDGAENVSGAYGYYIDEFRWDDTADIFSTDGWKELSYIGTYVGREQVRGSLFGRYGNAGRGAAFMAIHQKTQPYVTVSEDGTRANIRLRLFQFNSAAEAAGSWISGIYENQAILEEGIWRIHGMDLDYVWLADYPGGWAAIVPGSSERYRPTPEAIAKIPPDAPLRGVTFAPFPEIAPMGFHFDNPVSGRVPEVRLHWSDGRGRRG